MKISIRKGVSFGLTSGIITTLGLIIGLNSSTHSKIVILGGILTIAIADAFSDSLGIHLSEESGNKQTTNKQIWESTGATFLSKLLFSLTFLIPFILLSLRSAIIVSIIWGLLIITLLSYYVAKWKKSSAFKAISEHLIITGLVIFATHYTGALIASIFS